MKKDKNFDAVKIMRTIRDRMSEELKGLSPREQIEYIEKKSGLQRKGNKHATSVSDSGLQAR